jgi:hypothetical protein
MLVSASVMASFNITTFYTGVSLVVGAGARKALIYFTFMGFQFETQHPEPIIKLIEAVYIKRHEVDLVGEEELYRMLQEIIRQPELIKQLSGTSMKGAMDPIYDKLPEVEKRKLEHLENMERKGFDVARLREALLERVSGDDAD